MTSVSAQDPTPVRPRPAPARSGPPERVAPATTARRLRARSRPPAVRLAVMTGNAAASKAAFTWVTHVRRDPAARLFSVGRGDPYPLYEELRAQGPLGRSALGFHYTADHAIAAEVLTSRAWGASPSDPTARTFDGDLDLSLLQLNPPVHTRLRRVVTPVFGRRRMEGYRDRVVSTLDRLLDAAPTDRPWDLMPNFAAALPIAVITDLLGIPDYDEAAFLRFGEATAGALDGIRSPRHAFELLQAQVRLEEVFTRLFDLRSREPGDDAISAVVAARDEGRIAAEDMVPLCTLLLLAGFETTVNLIGSAVALLLHRPEQWRMLVDDPSLAERAVEETLRYFSPVQLTGRFALEETEVAGRVFAPGESLVPLVAAANRDPAVFDRPNVFDPTRANAADHLAFSAGSHYCIGAPLARLEATLALGALAQRMPDLTLAGPVVPRSGVTLRGPESLVVCSSGR